MAESDCKPFVSVEVWALLLCLTAFPMVFNLSQVPDEPDVMHRMVETRLPGSMFEKVLVTANKHVCLYFLVVLH